MNAKTWIWQPAALLVMLALGLAGAQADVLELRDGQRLEGSFRGGDDQTLRFDANEELHLIPVDQALRLQFGPVGERAAAAPLPKAQAATRPAPAPHAVLAEKAGTPAAASRAAASPSQASPPSARSLEIPVGTLLRVRISDTVDPHIGAEGDRFAGLLETGLSAGGAMVIPARTRVYGVVSEARSQGPIASRLKLELTGLMLGGEMVELVSATHKVVTGSDASGPPASAGGASRADRVPAGSLLEFRLLQAVELPIR